MPSPCPRHAFAMAGLRGGIVAISLSESLPSQTKREALRSCERRSLPFPFDDGDLAAASAAAEEPLVAIGIEPRDADTGRHPQALENVAGGGIDVPYIAFVAFPGAMPEFAVDPGDAGDETVAGDGAKNRAGFGIDLVDLALAVLPDPERALGPGEAGVATGTRRRDGGEHAAGRRVDLLDAALGDLEQVLSIEGRAGVGGDVDGAKCFPAGRIERGQCVAGGKPDAFAVIGNATHAVDAREGAVLADDFRT